jgi:hypothetical protein
MKEFTEEERKDFGRGLKEQEETLVPYFDQLDKLIFLLQNHNIKARSRELQYAYSRLEEGQMWLSKEINKLQELLKNY